MAETKAKAKAKFGRGGAQAKEVAKTLNARPKTRFLTLKDGEQMTVRFIDDSPDWIYVKQHSFVPTKPAPEDAPDEVKKNWPPRMQAVCRHDEAFSGMYEDCYICDNMVDEKSGKPFNPQLRLWARAQVREEVKGTDEMVEEKLIKPFQVGKTVGMIDKEVEDPEVDDKGKPTGKTKKHKEVILINQGHKNFFGALQGAFEIYGTVLDRDYRIKRSGEGTDTEYSIVPLDPVPGRCLDCDGTGKVDDETCKHCDGDKKVIFTLEDDRVRERYLDVIDLEEYVADQASDDKYARWFDPTKKVKYESRDKDGDSKGSGADTEIEEAEPAKNTGGVDPEQLEAMKARVRAGSGGSKKAAPAEESAAEEQEEVAAINFSG